MSDTHDHTHGDANDDGRGALIGEFMQSFFQCPPELQDQIIFLAVQKMASVREHLIDPYPVLSHLHNLITKKNSKAG